MGFAFMTAGAFFSGGLGHMMIRSSALSHQPLGKDWGSMNGDWMYAWLPAVFLMPVTAFANMAVMLAAYDLSNWALAVPYILGVCVGMVEGFLMTDGALLTNYSGVPSALMFLFSSSTCMVLACIKATRDRKDREGGMLLAMFGNILIFLGWLLVGLTPAGCRKYSQPVRECPFPNNFNQNAFFHIFIMAAVIVLFFAVTTYARSLSKSYFLLDRMP